MCKAHEGAIEQGKEIGIVLGEKRGFEIGRKDGIEIGRKDGIEIGRKDGIEIGRKDGIEIGRYNQKLESARNLLMIGASIEMVVNRIGLSYETVEKLYLQLNDKSHD